MTCCGRWPYSPKKPPRDIWTVLFWAGLEWKRIPATCLVGLPAPGNYGPEFKNAFEAMYVDLAAKYDVPLYPDFLRPLSENGGRWHVVSGFDAG